MQRIAVAFGITATAVALFTGSALAAAPIPVGAGSRPAVAIDPAGTAYIAFNGTENSNAKLHFCRLPRGAAACSTAIDLPIPASGDSLSRPFVSVSGSTVRVLSYRYGTPGGDHDFLFTSTTGGASFGAPAPVGDLPPDGDAVGGPGGGISIVNRDSANHQYQRVPTDGSAAATTRATLSTTYLSGGAVGLVNATTPLVAFDDASATPASAFSVYKGAGSVNDGGNWTAPAVIAPGSSEHLASGPSGLFLMLNAPSGRREVRKYNGAAFGAPTPLPDSQTNISGEHLFQDATGTLHASWADASGTLWYATSADGTTWSTQRVVTGATDGPRDTRLAAASDHRGFAVYVLGTGSGAHVLAVPVGPPPPPPPPPPAGRIGADFSWSPGTPCTGVQVSLSGAASAALSEDPIVNYRWMFDNSVETYPPYNLTPIFVPVFDGGASPAAATVYRANRTTGMPAIGATFYYYRDPASVTLTVTDSRGRQATVTKVITFGDPVRTSFYSVNPFAGLFAPVIDPIRLCRTQKAIRKLVGASFKGKPRIIGGAAVLAAAACPAGTAGCGGFFGVISDRPRRISSGAAAAKARRPTTLGAKAFTLAPGKRKTLKVKLTKRGRALIRRRHLKRVTAVLLTVNARGARDTHTAVIKLRRRGRAR